MPSPRTTQSQISPPGPDRGGVFSRLGRLTLPVLVSVGVHAALLAMIATVTWTIADSAQRDPGPMTALGAPSPETAQPERADTSQAASGAASTEPTPTVPEQTGPPPSAPGPIATPTPAPPQSFEGVERASPVAEVAARPRRVSFAGVDAQYARRVVFVVDTSGAMVSCLPFVLDELERALARLGPNQRFQVISTADRTSMDPDASNADIYLMRGVPPGMYEPTPANRAGALAWLRSQRPSGRWHPVAGLERAFAFEPDVVFFLTRAIARTQERPGADDHATILARLNDLNPIDRRLGRRRTVIRCVQMLEPDPTGLLEAIAREHADGDGGYAVRTIDQLREIPSGRDPTILAEGALDDAADILDSIASRGDDLAILYGFPTADQRARAGRELQRARSLLGPAIELGDPGGERLAEIIETISQMTEAPIESWPERSIDGGAVATETGSGEIDLADDASLTPALHRFGSLDAFDRASWLGQVIEARPSWAFAAADAASRAALEEAARAEDRREVTRLRAEAVSHQTALVHSGLLGVEPRAALESLVVRLQRFIDDGWTNPDLPPEAMFAAALSNDDPTLQARLLEELIRTPEADHLLEPVLERFATLVTPSPDIREQLRLVHMLLDFYDRRPGHARADEFTQRALHAAMNHARAQEPGTTARLAADELYEHALRRALARDNLGHQAYWTQEASRVRLAIAGARKRTGDLQMLSRIGPEQAQTPAAVTLYREILDSSIAEFAPVAESGEGEQAEIARITIQRLLKGAIGYFDVRHAGHALDAREMLVEWLGEEERSEKLELLRQVFVDNASDFERRRRVGLTLADAHLAAGELSEAFALVRPLLDPPDAADEPDWLAWAIALETLKQRDAPGVRADIRAHLAALRTRDPALGGAEPAERLEALEARLAR
ncbi:MAG: hypothetical protein JJU33_14690 [Phycisphaerales bacterium]|nr:hypothetical protein [Phycisphaerales bacterium]